MQRRTFLQLSGLSAAGLLIPPITSARGRDPFLLSLPRSVSLRTGNQVVLMSGADGSKWKYRDVEVTLEQPGDRIGVLVQAAGTPLEEVTLAWDDAVPGGASVLGDAWERTYGDVHWQAPGDRRLPWYCIVHDSSHTSCFGVRTGCRAFCSWKLDNTGLQLCLDLRNGGSGVELGGRQLHAADIVTSGERPGENAFATVRRFCTVMCDRPRLMEQPVYGINDWYYTYGSTSAATILELATFMAAFADNASNPPFCVVDDGWAVKSPLQPDDCCWGDDYALPNAKFPDMKLLADHIRQTGMRPGLWTRPLTASHLDKKNLLLPPIPGRDDPRSPILDPTIAENMDRVKNLWNTYHQWGYEMVKLDYTTYDLFGKWGFEMADGMTAPGWYFNDRSRTNAEIILDLYGQIREAAGTISLIGCNTVSHLAAGLFELNRIGDDTSGKEWSRTRKMGVNTLGFRMVQQETFYEADGDCVGLTSAIPWEKNRQWLKLLAMSSAPLFVSPEPAAIGGAQRQALKESFHTASRQQPVAEPLDWLTNEWPSTWRLDGQVARFDWDG